MRVLLWSPPWAVHGDPHFFRNAFVKHICLQANALLGFAEKVSVAIPAHFENDAACLERGVDVIELPLSASKVGANLGAPIYQALYTQPESDFVVDLTRQFRPLLPDKVDVVFQW